MLASFFLQPVFALDPTVSTGQYLHTSWTQEEGTSLPAVQALAQTADGFLWLGTANGLIRFDGLRFVHWQPPAGETIPGGDVLFLQPAAQGSLWIGTSSGIARLVNGHLIRYPAVERWLNGARLVDLFQAHDGNLWLIGVNADQPSLALAKADGLLRVYGVADGLPPERLQKLFEDGSGNLWLGTKSRLCRWTPAVPADCSLFPQVNAVLLGQTGEGNLFVWDAIGHRFLSRSGEKLPSLDPAMEPRLTARDHEGNHWIGTAGQGLLRWNGTQAERLTRKDGLSSDFVNALMEDREGNFWVGTARGIDRFRDPKVLRLSTANGLSSDVILAVQATADGAIWVGTSGGGLNRVAGRQVTPYPASAGLPSSSLHSLSEDTAGRLWIGGAPGLAYRTPEGFVPVPAPDGTPIVVMAMAERAPGRMAVATFKRQLLEIRDGTAQPLTLPGLEKKDIYRLQKTPDGTLWIGYYQGGLTAVRGNAAKTYTASDGLADGAVLAISHDRAGSLWVGTATGLSRWRHGVWTTWDQRHGFTAGAVLGIMEDNGDGLWLVTGQGILRLPRTVLSATPDGSPGPLAFTVYGRAEGLRLSGASIANPRIARSADGRLWVATGDGVAILNPDKIRRNSVPPPVAFEQVQVDGKSLDTAVPGGLRFRGQELEISYTGLSFTDPENVRFRYWLEGVDRNWIDAGTRRNVTYVNLSPGQYRFRVLAANSEGVWNTTGAALPFFIVPYFYQTVWFKALVVVLLMVSVRTVYLLRVKYLVARFNAIQQERTRLTRELHDSLLQGFAGVVMQLEAVDRQFESHPETSRRRLAKAIGQAEESLREARNVMSSMRLPELENRTLPEALSDAGSKATEGTGIAFQLGVKGHARLLPYEMQANLFLIGREAVTNSVNHSHARRIATQLVYSAKEVCLTVQDDGLGFDPEIRKEGHWGVAGMRERAKQMGGTIRIDSQPDRGTKIELAVPVKR